MYVVYVKTFIPVCVILLPHSRITSWVQCVCATTVLLLYNRVGKRFCSVLVRCSCNMRTEHSEQEILHSQYSRAGILNTANHTAVDRKQYHSTLRWIGSLSWVLHTHLLSFPYLMLASSFSLSASPGHASYAASRLDTGRTAPHIHIHI